MQAKNTSTEQCTDQYVARNLFGGYESAFEICERRLVLSAQLLLDVLDSNSIDLHGQLSSDPPPIELHNTPQVEVPAYPKQPLEQHLREAHTASGWYQVQQEFGLTGSGQTVAVIDSGIAWDHLALGSGYGPGYRVVGGWDFTEENDNRPYDDGPAGFHGTHVAGIIGSSDTQHRGVAPNADLVALRVFNDAGQGQLSWVENALQWVHTNRNSFENPITTVNLSLGTTWNADIIPNWATLEEELQQLANDGITVVASAGNSFAQYNAPGLSYPAASPNVLPVASVGDDGELSDFSQRASRVLAAPGERIMSTVPDYVLGRDGIVNDFSTASGTSMAAPYVAGASVLVRQAMEMVGWDAINLSTISQHLHDTADSIYDAATGAFYDRLNLQSAIDTIIPDDTVGDTSGAATQISLQQTEISGWINSLGDRDVYRFTADATGTLALDADSDWASTLQWSLLSGGQTLNSGDLDPQSVQVLAGQTYELVVSASGRIGSFTMDVDFTTNAGGGEGGLASKQDLGQVDYYGNNTAAAGTTYRVQAAHDGVFTVQWNNPDAAGGSLLVHEDNYGASSGVLASDATWEHGQLRLDMQVQAGQWLNVSLPGTTSDTGELAIANIVAHSGGELNVYGTLASDSLSVDLQSGLKLRFEAIEYVFANGEIDEVHIDSYASNDDLAVLGSARSDIVELSPSGSTIESSEVRLVIASVENIDFVGGGGPDRVYLYDSDSDDTLTARPREAELVGVGYRFSVSDVDRMFMHATGGGQDYAYLYDSIGDDRLSVRPQFTSLSGDGFFNYVRGFERVYAYANAGGFDEADLYDSAGNDRFLTNGASASIVGPGFSSYTKSFELVHAHAAAGGQDVASMYGSDQHTNWQRGSDFVSFKEQQWHREARGFENVETFAAGQPHTLATQAVAQEPTSWLTGQDLASPTDGQPQHGDQAFILSSGNYASSLREWLIHEAELPEEELLNNPNLELEILDAIFGVH
ncbi:MAG: S8 family serine peptidase [Pirellulaceae bacterium]